MSSTTGRKRVTERHYSAEEQALDQISKEAEARIQARRAARAEAREIRLREIEKQQKEEEERLKAQEADSGKSLSSYSGSRRGSDESTSTDTDLRDKDPKDAVRQLKSVLRDLEEKYKKTMSTNAQLDNQKQTLVYQVELLKDQLEEQEESMIEVQREYKDKCREFENQKRSFIDLEIQYNSLKEQMSYRDRLLQESGFAVVSTEEGQLKLEKCSNMTNGPVIPQGSLLISDEAAEMLAKAGEGSLGISDKNGSLSVPQGSDLHFNSHSHVAGNMDYEINLSEQASHKNEKEISRETVDITQVAEYNKIEFKDHNGVHTFQGDSTTVISKNGVSEIGNIVSEGWDGFEKKDDREINDQVGKEDELIKEVAKEEEGNVEEEEEMKDEDEKDGKKEEEKIEEDMSEQGGNEIVDKCNDAFIDKSKQDVLVVVIKEEGEKEVDDDEVFDDALEVLGEGKPVGQIVQDVTSEKEVSISEGEYVLEEQPVFSSVSSEVVITFKDDDGDSKEVEVAGQTDESREDVRATKERKESIDQEQVDTFVGNGKEDEMDGIEATVNSMGYETKMVDKDDDTSSGGCEVHEVHEILDEDDKLDVLYQEKNSINDDQENEEKVACEEQEDIVVCRKEKEIVDGIEQEVVVQGQVDEVVGQGQKNTMSKDGQVVVDQAHEDEVFGQIQEKKVVDNGQEVVGQEKIEVVCHRQEDKVVNNEQENDVQGQVGIEVRLHNDWQDVFDQETEDKVVSQEQFLQTVGSKLDDVKNTEEVSQEEVLGKKPSTSGSLEIFEECAKELVHSVIGKAVLISQLDCEEKRCWTENGNLGDDCKNVFKVIDREGESREEIQAHEMLGVIVNNEFPDNKTLEEDGLACAGDEKESLLRGEDVSSRSPYTKSESLIAVAEHHSLSCDIVESVTLCNASELEISSSVIAEEGERTEKIDNPALEGENIDSSQNKDIGSISESISVDRIEKAVQESEESSTLSVSDNEASTQSLSEETSSPRNSTAILEAEALTVESAIGSNKEATSLYISESETVTSGGQKGSKKEVMTSNEDHEMSKVKSEGAKGARSQNESQEKKHSKEMKTRKSKKKSKEEGGVGKEKQDDKDCSIS
ncbi:hypothetical protein CHS0354_014446 [Potamilus streckersoni]|uniref:Leucine-rich repeat flightless-interacting protein 1 n=1 Tax=Potamilus streckersoni TaxID=2493646 RepID=A0AAE0S9M8_9BIVA|nr:hypothetical protein CHS0354_014446 [Potamilus streckersoni]